jgi:hypothetical protein
LDLRALDPPFVPGAQPGIAGAGRGEVVEQSLRVDRSVR